MQNSQTSEYYCTDTEL